MVAISCKMRSLVICIVLCSIALSGSAQAAFSIFYFQDGRRLNNVADAQALIDSTDAVHSTTSNTLNFREAGTTTGAFSSSANIVPLETQSNYAVFAVGQLQIDVTGDYTFNIFSDDGFSFDINGSTVASFLRPRGPRSTTQPNIFLTAGLHDIEVVYFERTGRAAFELSQTLGNQSTFTPATFNLSVSTAPEPSAWALMLIGFGGVATRMKMSRQKARPVMTNKKAQVFPGGKDTRALRPWDSTCVVQRTQGST